MELGAMTNPRLSPVPQITWIGQHGFDFVDLALEPPAADTHDIDTVAVLAAVDRHSLGVVVHTSPFLPIANPHQSARQMALDELLRSLKIALPLRAQLMTIHYLESPRFFTQDEVVDYYADMLSLLCDAAVGTGVGIAIENSPRNQGEVMLFNEIFQRVPMARLLLDIGHANMNVSTNLTAEFLWDHIVGQRLSHVHISENDGVRDLHLPLESSRISIDWSEVVNLLRKHGYDGTVTLEIFSPDLHYLLASQDKFRALWARTV